jgi:polyferredoxin
MAKVSRLRIMSQTLSFVVINLGFLGALYTGIPLAILSCNYLKLRIFDCFLYVIQDGLATGSQGGTLYLYTLAEFFVLFVVMALLFGTGWCGWICPLGYVQDLFIKGRAMAGIGYYRVPARVQRHIKLIKYLFLAVVIIISLVIGLPSIRETKLRNDWYLPLCQICPAKPLFLYLQILVGILPATTDVPLLSIAVLPLFLVGAFMIRRGWCIICPNLAALSFFHKLNAISLFRKKERCTKCGTCTRICSMDAPDDALYGDVSRPECVRCLQCIEECPADKSRSSYLFRRKILESRFPKLSKR